MLRTDSFRSAASRVQSHPLFYNPQHEITLLLRLILFKTFFGGWALENVIKSLLRVSANASGGAQVKQILPLIGAGRGSRSPTVKSSHRI